MKEHKPINIYEKIYNNIEVIILITILLLILVTFFISKFNSTSPFNLEKNYCDIWNKDSDIVYPLERDDITKEEWVKCCVQRVQPNGVIKACEYIKLK